MGGFNGILSAKKGDYYITLLSAKWGDYYYMPNGVIYYYMSIGVIFGSWSICILCICINMESWVL